MFEEVVYHGLQWLIDNHPELFVPKHEETVMEFSIGAQGSPAEVLKALSIQEEAEDPAHPHASLKNNFIEHAELYVESLPASIDRLEVSISVTVTCFGSGTLTAAPPSPSSAPPPPPQSQG